MNILPIEAQVAVIAHLVEGELVEAATVGALPEPQGRQIERFWVIDGGAH